MSNADDSPLASIRQCYNCTITEDRWLCARCAELYEFNEQGTMVVRQRKLPDPRRLLSYARLLELCAEFGITETDDLKHRLEDWERWNADLRSGALASGAIEVQPGLYVAKESTSIFHQKGRGPSKVSLERFNHDAEAAAGSPSEAPDNQKIKK